MRALNACVHDVLSIDRYVDFLRYSDVFLYIYTLNDDLVYLRAVGGASCTCQLQYGGRRLLMTNLRAAPPPPSPAGTPPKSPHPTYDLSPPTPPRPDA